MDHSLIGNPFHNFMALPAPAPRSSASQAPPSHQQGPHQPLPEAARSQCFDFGEYKTQIENTLKEQTLAGREASKDAVKIQKLSSSEPVLQENGDAEEHPLSAADYSETPEQQDPELTSRQQGPDLVHPNQRLGAKRPLLQNFTLKDSVFTGALPRKEMKTLKEHQADDDFLPQATPEEEEPSQSKSQPRLIVTIDLSEDSPAHDDAAVEEAGENKESDTNAPNVANKRDQKIKLKEEAFDPLRNPDSELDTRKRLCMLQKIVGNREKNFTRGLRMGSVIGMSSEYLMENVRLNGYMRGFRSASSSDRIYEFVLQDVQKVYRKYFTLFAEALEDEIYEETQVTISNDLKVIVYPLFVLLFALEEFDAELVELLWWGIEGQGDCPSTQHQFKKLVLKLASLLNPICLVDNFKRNIETQENDLELKEKYEVVLDYLTSHFRDSLDQVLTEKEIEEQWESTDFFGLLAAKDLAGRTNRVAFAYYQFKGVQNLCSLDRLTKDRHIAVLLFQYLLDTQMMRFHEKTHLRQAQNEAYAAFQNLLNLNPFCQRIFWLAQNSPKYNTLLNCSFFVEKTTSVSSDMLQTIFKGMYWELIGSRELEKQEIAEIGHSEISLQEFKISNAEVFLV